MWNRTCASDNFLFLHLAPSMNLIRLNKNSLWHGNLIKVSAHREFLDPSHLRCLIQWYSSTTVAIAVADIASWNVRERNKKRNPIQTTQKLDLPVLMLSSLFNEDFRISLNEPQEPNAAGPFLHLYFYIHRENTTKI